MIGTSTMLSASPSERMCSIARSSACLLADLDPRLPHIAAICTIARYNPDPLHPARLDGATREAGSWWLDWKRWMARHQGAKIPARVPGEGALPVLEDAPGSYVCRGLPD